MLAISHFYQLYLATGLYESGVIFFSSWKECYKDIFPTEEHLLHSPASLVRHISHNRVTGSHRITNKQTSSCSKKIDVSLYTVTDKSVVSPPAPQNLKYMHHLFLCTVQYMIICTQIHKYLQKQNFNTLNFHSKESNRWNTTFICDCIYQNCMKLNES